MTEFRYDSTEKREGLPEYDPDTPCHKCSSCSHLRTNCGLAGGGVGVYTFCDACEVVVSKSVETDDY